MKLFNNNMTMVEKSLDAYSKRAKALANNIANVNTPNYKRQDVQFEHLLENAMSEDTNSKVTGTISNNKHFKINPKTDLENLEANVIREMTTTMRNDGNNVDIEKENAEFAKNNIRYKFATSKISSDFGLLKSVIKAK